MTENMKQNDCIYGIYGNKVTIYTKCMETKWLYAQSGCINMREKLKSWHVISKQSGFEESYIDSSCR